MFQASGRLNYGLKPACGARFDALDSRRLRDYFERVLSGSAPQHGDRQGWEKLLRNVDLMTDSSGASVATVNGVLLFGRAPNRHVPQAGIRAIAYPGSEPDYATRADEDLRGPMVPLAGADGPLIGLGLVDVAWDFVRRNTTPTARLEGMRRVDRWESGVRYARNQTLVNVMRDYGYVDARGMGVRNKIIPGMRVHNGTEPDLIEEEHRFTIRLWKEAKSS